MAEAKKYLVDSLPQVAEFFGCAGATARNWSQQMTSDGVDAHVGKKWNLATIAKWLAQQRASGRTSTDDLERKRRAEADLFEARAATSAFDLELKRGKYWLARDVKLFFNEHLLRAKDQLLRLPLEVSRLMPKKYRLAAQEDVDRHIRNTLTEMSEWKTSTEADLGDWD